MLSFLSVLVVLLLSSLSVRADVSFCDKYSMALFNSTDGATETKLIAAVVTRAVLGDRTANPPVEGLVGPRSPILRVSSRRYTYCTPHVNPTARHCLLLADELWLLTSCPAPVTVSGC